MPGYTHFQIAMPSSFGMWFGAYAECLTDDVLLLNSAYQMADQNPLGSAAGYGNSFPLDREMTTKLMGFSTLKYNSIAAQLSRGKLEKTSSFALSGIAGTLSKLSMDICLYISQNFGFVSFPDELTTGSSIMPHKKNPDVWELIRAKCNKLQALPNEIRQEMEESVVLVEKLKQEIEEYTKANEILKQERKEEKRKNKVLQNENTDLKDSDFNYTPLMQAFADFKIAGVVISESPNLEKDAQLMQKTYRKLGSPS